MRGLILVLLLLLSACWQGKNLYGIQDARVAMPPGTYLAVEAGGRSNLTVRSDGLLMMGGDYLAFAPLDERGNSFVAWASGEWGDGDDHQDMGMYGLLQRQDNGDYLLFVPACADTREIARASGASVETKDGTVSCYFPTRASLEDALRRLRPNPGEAHLRLTPVSSRPGK